MFEFNAPIVRRRKIKKLNILTGMGAAALLGYLGITFLEMGMVPIIEKIVSQIGLTGYSGWIYLGLFIALIIPIIATIRMFSQKKMQVGGEVAFDEKVLKIKKGREEYLIPQEDLTQLDFELQKRPSGKKKKEGQLFGGNYMRIPTKKGTFVCELDLNDERQKEKLLEMVEFLKIEHDVEVKIKYQ